MAELWTLICSPKCPLRWQWAVSTQMLGLDQGQGELQVVPDKDLPLIVLPRSLSLGKRLCPPQSIPELQPCLQKGDSYLQIILQLPNISGMTCSLHKSSEKANTCCQFKARVCSLNTQCCAPSVYPACLLWSSSGNVQLPSHQSPPHPRNAKAVQKHRHCFSAGHWKLI